MVKCRKCDDDVVQSKDGCKCADCQTVFHIICVSDTFKKRGSKTWKCEECVFDSTSDKGDGDQDKANAPVLKAISLLRKEMNDRWDKTDVKLDKVQTDITGINSEISRIKEDIVNVKTQADNSEEKVGQLIEKNKQLEDELAKSKLDLHDLQQHTRKNNIVISGIPALPRGADVFPILQKIAQLLDVPFYRTDFNAAHWLPVREGDTRTQSIVVSFVSRVVKHEWLSARRRRRTLKAGEILPQFSNTEVYLNEQLTPETRSIFNAARSLMKAGKLASVWTNDGRVMAKRGATGRPFRVTSLNDLELRTPPPQSDTHTATSQPIP